MNFSIKVEDNSKLVLAEMEKAVERALYVMGVNAVEGSVQAISGAYNTESAVDTGRLRASISFITPTEKGDSGQPKPPNAKSSDELSGQAPQNTVVTGSNVEYAEFVHNGTSKMQGRPFLREGIEQKKGDMQRQVEKVFKGQL